MRSATKLQAGHRTRSNTPASLKEAARPAAPKPWALKIAGPDFVADEDKDSIWLIDFYREWFVYSVPHRGWVLMGEPNGGNHRPSRVVFTA
jgi:hypothetical protein